MRTFFWGDLKKKRDSEGFLGSDLTILIDPGRISTANGCLKKKRNWKLNSNLIISRFCIWRFIPVHRTLSRQSMQWMLLTNSHRYLSYRKSIDAGGIPALTHKYWLLSNWWIHPMNPIKFQHQMSQNLTIVETESDQKIGFGLENEK